MTERALAAEMIAVAFDDWLQAEVVTSGEGRNRYLDASAADPEEALKKFKDVRRRLALHYDDDQNWNAQKDKSHQQRWRQWLDDSEQEPQDDFLTARVIFAPLMSVSGAFRVQSYLLGDSPEGYIKYRSRAIGIDIERTVDSRLREREYSKGFTAAEITFDGLKEAFKKAYSDSETFMRGMSNRLRLRYPEDTPQSKSVKDMQIAQYNHIQLATDAVILAAKIREGVLETVPFLEPVSITDQSGSTHYPLSERINWLEVLAA